eukprot:4319913-Prymnesium_polylepis.1
MTLLYPMCTNYSRNEPVGSSSCRGWAKAPATASCQGIKGGGGGWGTRPGRLAAGRRLWF